MKTKTFKISPFLSHFSMFFSKNTNNRDNDFLEKHLNFNFSEKFQKIEKIGEIFFFVLITKISSS